MLCVYYVLWMCEHLDVYRIWLLLTIVVFLALYLTVRACKFAPVPSFCNSEVLQQIVISLSSSSSVMCHLSFSSSCVIIVIIICHLSSPSLVIVICHRDRHRHLSSPSSVIGRLSSSSSFVFCHHGHHCFDQSHHRLTIIIIITYNRTITTISHLNYTSLTLFMLSLSTSTSLLGNLILLTMSVTVSCFDVLCVREQWGMKQLDADSCAVCSSLSSHHSVLFYVCVSSVNV